MATEIAPLQRKTSISAQLAAQIRGLISSGEWAVGSKIPAESELMAQLDMSRNSVREAIRGLVNTGLLEARVGDGTYVLAKNELETVLRRNLEVDQLEELFEVRFAFERLAARNAAVKATPQQIAAMSWHLDARDDSTDSAEYIRHDANFHTEMVKAAGNTLLTELYINLDAVRIQLGSLQDLQAKFEQFRAENSATDDSHRGLLAAIVRGDAEQAEKHVGELIEEVRLQHELS